MYPFIYSINIYYTMLGDEDKKISKTWAPTQEFIVYLGRQSSKYRISMRCILSLINKAIQVIYNVKEEIVSLI